MKAMAKAPDPLEEIVRKNIIAFREGAGFSQAEAADLSGVPVYNLSRYERGESKSIPATVLHQLAEVYGRKLEDFYDPDPPPPAKVEDQPAIFLRTRPAVEIDQEIYQAVVRAVREANATLRSKKKIKRER